MDNNIPAEEQMSSAQLEIAGLLKELTVEASGRILLAIKEAFTKSPQDFIESHIGNIRGEIMELDGRTTLFLEKMANIIQLHLDSLDTMPELFQVLSLLTENANVTKELIKSKTLPLVHELIEGLDRIRPSIVNELVYFSK